MYVVTGLEPRSWKSRSSTQRLNLISTYHNDRMGRRNSDRGRNLPNWPRWQRLRVLLYFVLSSSPMVVLAPSRLTSLLTSYAMHSSSLHLSQSVDSSPPPLPERFLCACSAVMRLHWRRASRFWIGGLIDPSPPGLNRHFSSQGRRQMRLRVGQGARKCSDLLDSRTLGRCFPAAAPDMIG
jgi:hypothetical protein